MTRGRLMAMPLLVANMGGEMIYILEQRLRAQSISPSKASKGEQACPPERRKRPAKSPLILGEGRGGLASSPLPVSGCVCRTRGGKHVRCRCRSACCLHPIEPRGLVRIGPLACPRSAV